MAKRAWKLDIANKMARQTTGSGTVKFHCTRDGSAHFFAGPANLPEYIKKDIRAFCKYNRR